jgi:hypothetical protein
VVGFAETSGLRQDSSQKKAETRFRTSAFVDEPIFFAPEFDLAFIAFFYFWLYLELH